jgi:hypothetical protein
MPSHFHLQMANIFFTARERRSCGGTGRRCWLLSNRMGGRFNMQARSCGGKGSLCWLLCNRVGWRFNMQGRRRKDIPRPVLHCVLQFSVLGFELCNFLLQCTYVNLR